MGSFLFILIINKLNKKCFIIVSLIIKGGVLYGFTDKNIITLNKYMFLILRFISGMFYSMLTLYFPIWNYQLGLFRIKQYFNTWIVLAIPIGKSFIFLFSYLISYINWRYCFIAESLALFVTAWLIIPIRHEYFSSKLTFKKNIRDDIATESKGNKVSIFTMRSSNTSKSTNNNSNQWGYICCNLEYIGSTLSKTVMLGVSSCLVFFMQSNLRYIYEIKDEQFIVLSSCLMILIPPVLAGIIVNCFSCFLASQKQKQNFILFISILGVVALSVPLIPSDNQLIMYMITSSLYRLFVCCSNPFLTEIIFTSLSRASLKTIQTGYSLTSICGNFLGLSLAPYIYSLLGGHKKAYIFLCIYGTLGVMFILISKIGKYSTYEKKEENQILLEFNDKGEVIKRDNKRNNLKDEAFDELSINVKVNINDDREDSESDNEVDDNVYKLQDITKNKF